MEKACRTAEQEILPVSANIVSSQFEQPLHHCFLSVESQHYSAQQHTGIAHARGNRHNSIEIKASLVLSLSH